MLFVVFLPCLPSVCTWDNKTGFLKPMQVVVTISGEVGSSEEILVERKKCLVSVTCCWYVNWVVLFSASYASAIHGRLHYCSPKKPHWSLVLQEHPNSGTLATNILQGIIHFYVIIHFKTIAKHDSNESHVKETKGMYSVAIQWEVNKGMQNYIFMETIKIQVLTSRLALKGLWLWFRRAFIPVLA